MTQLHLIEQAKQGDPQAIAALMNKSLQPKGMTALVNRQGDCLEVILEAERIPNRQALTTFVQKGIHNLEIESIRSIRVLGQQIGAATPAWTQELDLLATSEFEPESDFVSSSLTADASHHLLDDSLTVPQPLDDSTDLSSEHTDFFASGEVLPDDLSQLQELLSEQSDPSLPNFQRQELEARLEHLWAEQSQTSQDFLTEILADESSTEQFFDQNSDQVDHAVQFEDFLTEASEVKSEPEAHFSELWADQRSESQASEQSSSDSEFNLQLSDLQSDSLMALEPMALESSEEFQDFFSESSPTDSSSVEESNGSWIDQVDDEPDEILLDFMPDQPSFSEMEIDEQGDILDEPDEVLVGFLERQTESSSPMTAPNGEPDFDLSLGTSDSFQTAPSSEADLLDFFDEPASEQPAPAGTEDWAIDLSEETDHSSAAWDQPPIEFLAGEPEPPQPELPTEHMAADANVLSESAAINPHDEFPVEFLNELPDSSSQNLSADSFVDPHENPFMEHMEGNNREDTPNLPPDSQMPDSQTNDQWEQFDPADWQIAQNQINEQPSDSFDQFDQFDQSPKDEEASPQFAEKTEASDDLDAALINFFAEESADVSETIDPADSAWQSSENWDFSENWQAEPESNPESGINQVASSNPEESYSSEDWGSVPESATSTPSDTEPDFQFSDDFQFTSEGFTDDFSMGFPSSEPEESVAYSSGLPDTEIPDTGIPEAEFSDYEFSDSNSDPGLSDTEIPQAGIPNPPPDAEMPTYEEPSQEALEAQLAGFQLENSSEETPSAAVATTTAEPESRAGSPWLFPLILLGIGGWIFGLISFALVWSRLSSPTTPDEVVTSADVVDTASPSPIAAATTCNAPPVTPNSPPVALSSMQFQANEGNPQQVNLVGCVTNRTQRPIDIVSVLYRTGGNNNSAVGGLNFDNVVQPGQTVSFSSKFTLPSDTNNVAIDTIYWQPSGTATSQEARTSISLNR